MEITSLTKTRARQWFLTIHQSAPVFDNIDNAIKDIAPEFYAYILHDKDTNLNSGEITPEHYHLIVEFENARSFASISKSFKGAHIEKVASFSSSVNYLIHNTETSREKAGYDREQIITSDRARVDNILDMPLKRIFDSNMILDYFNEGILSITDFYRVFGSQIQRYIYLIEKLRPDFEQSKSVENSFLPENGDFD